MARPNRFLDRLRASAGRPLVVAHRGDSFRAPENTLLAAALGHREGADAWECDVHLTRDGVPVVVHDESLSRTTDVARRFPDDPRAARDYPVAQFDWEEIRTLDAGGWFLAAEGPHRSARWFGTAAGVPDDVRRAVAEGAVRIPTLEECLALTVRLDWLVNVEAKSFPSQPIGLVERVIAAVRAAGAADRVLVSSFDHRDVAEAKRRAPEVAGGALTETPLGRPGVYVRQLLGAECYHLSAAALGAESEAYLRRRDARSLDAETVAELNRVGVPVLVYTVNDARDGGLGTQLAGLGVSALFTDDVRGMRARLG